MSRPELDLFACPLDGISLIEASAGTGKTWNICGLVMRLLLERGLELPQILVVTFTNAATAELRERIRVRVVETLNVLQGGTPNPGDPFVPGLLQSLRQRHGLDDATLVQRLTLALQCFDEAAIFTIHGFCQRALADVPFAAGLPLALTPLPDDTELLQQAVNDFWRRHVAGDALDPALAAHLATGKDTPESWARLLARRLGKPLSPCLWPAALDAQDNASESELAAAYAAARECWLSEHEAVAQALRDAAPTLHAHSYGAEGIATALAGWRRWLQAGDALAPIDVDGDKLALMGAATLARRTRKGFEPPLHRFFALAEDLLAARSGAEQQLTLARLRLLRRLFEEGGAALRQRKRELRVVAFDDMLFNLHERLQQAPGLAAALRARFPAALIDEFQDTDPLQWAIFERVWGDGASPLLLVGDPKQAIYSFRNADLHTYLRARESASAVYTLRENQRSSPALIEALNALFQAHPRSFLMPGLDYVPAAVGARPRPVFRDLTAPDGADAGALQLWLLPRGEDGKPLLREDALRASVQATAGEIARLLREGRAGRVTLDGRPLEGADIAVLVRSHAQGARVRHALAALGVGSVALSQASVFHTAEAEELERVLAAVLEPAQPGRLRAALATEAMGLDAVALAALAADEWALSERMTHFAELKSCWLEHGVAALLRRWLQEDAVAERLLARPDGARRLTNLLHLGEALHEAAGAHPAPEALLRWLALQRLGRGGDETAQLRLESDQHLVRVVTIHKAKGLEYGLVFCPFLWDAQVPPPAPGGMVEVHDDQGRPVLDLRGGLDPDGDEAALRERQRAEGAAETLRLTYVALTRAVHRCHVVVGPYAARSGKGVTQHTGNRGWLNWLAAGDGFSDAAQWFGHPLGPDEIEAAWRRLAARCGAIRLSPLPMAPGEPLPAAETPRIESLAPPRHIAAGWRLGSYSALNLDTVAHERAGRDHDARVRGRTAGRADEAGLPRDDILRFPAGPAAGDAVHAAFEQADFTDPASWETAAWAALRAHPQPGSTGHEGRERAQAAMLQRLLQDVLSTEIAPGLRLRHLQPGRRLTEMEFNLPAPALSAAALDEALRALGLRVPPLGEEALGGYLRGFIDLVFEHEGRFWLLDWKSNLLGTNPADYAPEALAQAVAEQGYGLQLLLYTLALDRYLHLRVPDYRYETHFGGALLLFVRGVRPPWRNADGSATGVFRMRAAEADLRRLQALLGA
ncbi:exodeoxyribonuclease V subunit beta [Azohydromonas caseinilytica]|uniref:RecBCD enzyme subunit RecB n=1 Tax=Azohydromonas caseinilytica TaxID=2728836 RepID=A0A848F8W2_9BURK|nr:exodeoxyribonuclease V subunit beta [Azohydromonas caseinilytica]NML14939.1 exodeoxyribonuclease V subunit beta [Azohydromonas caseinilytica]